MKNSKTITALVMVFICLFFITSCEKTSQKNESTNVDDINITEDFNSALGEVLEEMNNAVDVDINPAHFDYDKGGVVLSLTAENSLFGQFRVGIKYIQLMDTSGYSFALFDANLAKKNIDIDFAGLTQGAKFLVHQPHVPIGAYKSLVIEFDFKEADTKSWVDGALLNTYLLSDDGLTFGVDQVGYRVSVDLSTGLVLVPEGSKTYINLHIDLDDSVLSLPALDNALPDNAALMIFHPSLDVSIDEQSRRMFFVGKFRSIIDMNLDVLPFDLMSNEGYDKLLNKDIEYKYDENTQFFIEGKLASLDGAQIALARETQGYARLEGVFKDSTHPVFQVDRVIFSGGDNTYYGMIKGSSGTSISLIHNKIQLNDFVLSSAVESINVSSGSAAYNGDSYKDGSNFSYFSKPYQYVTVSSGNEADVFVHSAKLSGYVESVEGSILQLRITSINHISKPSISYQSLIDVRVLPASKIKKGDHIVSEGYFYQNYFVSFSEKKYSPDIASLMVWLDEMPPNNALNTILVSKDAVTITEGGGETGKLSIKESNISDIPLTESVLNKSNWRYKRGGFVTSLSEDDMFNNLSFDDSASFYLQSYSVLNPHISKYRSFNELYSALQVMMADGAHTYSVFVKGKVSGNEISAKNSDRDLVKIRLRGRSIDSALARTIFDDDYHGEKKWGGLTLAQIGAIFGSVVGLLILEYVLEKMKLGPKSQLSSPDFCKPGKKSKKGNSSSGMAAKAKSKLKSAGGALGSIGGIASCLKKLSSFSTAEPDLKRFSKQINPDALYVDGEKGKNSTLLVLQKKKLTKKGEDFYKNPEQRKNFEKMLNASERINEVFNKKFGGLTELKAPVSDMAMRMKMNISPKLKKDNDVYTKLIELDSGVRDKILSAVDSGGITFDGEAGQDKFQKALQQATKAQTRGKNTTEIIEAFNLEMGFTEKNILTIDSNPNPSSSESRFNKKLNSLYSVEKAFMRFQIDQSPEMRNALLSELGPHSESIDENDDLEKIKKIVSNIIDGEGGIRDQIDTDGDAILQGKSKVLQVMKEKGAIRSNAFFEFQADSLVREKMMEDIKKTIITVETSSEDRISVKKLMDKYKDVKKTSLSATSGVSRADALKSSLENIIKNKVNIFEVDGSFNDVSKKRKIK